MTFSPEVYAIIRDGAKRSAAVIVPWLVEFIGPRTVIDVGCGEGWFAQEFAAHGCATWGIDSTVVETTSIGATSLRFSRVDLLTAESLQRRSYALAEIQSGGYWPTAYDLAVCLEVAEHLPETRAEWLIDQLCAVAPVIAFSAAVPGQGGHGHLNERWPSYWIPHFERNGFTVTDAPRHTFWDNETVEPWYRQNLVLAVAGDAEKIRERFGGERPTDVVHPVIWEHRRQRP